MKAKIKLNKISGWKTRCRPVLMSKKGKVLLTKKRKQTRLLGASGLGQLNKRKLTAFKSNNSIDLRNPLWLRKPRNSITNK